jgi:hypothetical protein
VLPQSVAPVIKTRLDQWLSDARAFSAAVLARSPSSNSETEHLRLASGAIGFDALATPLRYDMTGAERSADAMTTLRQHMLMFLPIVASIADRIETLERMQALPDALRQRLDDMAAWLRSGTVDPVAADRLRRAVADADPVLARAPAWRSSLPVTKIVPVNEGGGGWGAGLGASPPGSPLAGSPVTRNAEIDPPPALGG